MRDACFENDNPPQSEALPAIGTDWLVVEPLGELDLCWTNPGFNVDLYVATDLRTMTAIWMGLTTVKKEGAKVVLTGDQDIAGKMTWFGLSPFAIEAKRAAHRHETRADEYLCAPFLPGVERC